MFNLNMTLFQYDRISWIRFRTQISVFLAEHTDILETYTIIFLNLVYQTFKKCHLIHL